MGQFDVSGGGKRWRFKLFSQSSLIPFVELWVQQIRPPNLIGPHGLSHQTNKQAMTVWKLAFAIA